MYRKAETFGISSIVAVLVIIIIILAAVAGYAYIAPSGKTTTVTQTASGGTLAAQAQAECASASTCLTVYGLIDSGDWASVIQPLFVSQFPWTSGKINYVGLFTSSLVSRIVSEYQTGKVQADVIAESPITSIVSMESAGALANYSNPAVGMSNISQYDPQGYWYPIFTSYAVLIYNKHLLPANEVPTSWADLANPIYKNKISAQGPSTLGATADVFYYLYQTMGNSSGQWTSLMQKIATNSIQWTSFSGASDNEVVDGSIAMAIGIFPDYVAAVQAGNSSIVGLANLGVAPYVPSAVAITKDAPHPAMAQLMEQWLSSYAGAYALAKTGRTPYLFAVAQAFGLVPPNMTLYNTYTNPAILQNTGAWSDTFKSIFGA